MRPSGWNTEGRFISCGTPATWCCLSTPIKRRWAGETAVSMATSRNFCRARPPDMAPGTIMGGWIDSPLAARGDLLVIRYRDLRQDTQSSMEEILQFLGVGVDRQTILNAIRNNEFQKMRVKEDR